MCAPSFCLFPWPNEPVVQNGALPSPTCCLELFLPKPQPAALSAPGPGSAKELIKSINEKFAGATGWEGTEPYPLASVQPVAAGMGIHPSLGRLFLWQQKNAAQPLLLVCQVQALQPPMGLVRAGGGSAAAVLSPEVRGVAFLDCWHIEEARR